MSLNRIDRVVPAESIPSQLMLSPLTEDCAEPKTEPQVCGNGQLEVMGKYGSQRCQALWGPQATNAGLNATDPLADDLSKATCTSLPLVLLSKFQSEFSPK